MEICTLLLFITVIFLNVCFMFYFNFFDFYFSIIFFSTTQSSLSLLFLNKQQYNLLMFYRIPLYFLTDKFWNILNKNNGINNLKIAI